MAGGLDVGIRGGKNNEYIANVHRRNGDKGLVVFTEELHEKETRFGFALNPVLGFEMAINGAFSGVTDGIHNGGDSAGYTGTNIVGTKVTFDSTDTFTGWPSGGTKSVKVDKALLGDVWQFDKGSTIDHGSFIAISMDLYVVSGYAAGNSIAMYAYDTGTGLQVGDKIFLEDFFNQQEFGTPHFLSFTLSELNVGIQTYDTYRMEIVEKTGAGIVFYLDKIRLEETTGSSEFDVIAPPNTKFYIEEFRFTFIGPNDTTLTDSSMPNISYNKILNLSKLPNGIGFSRTKRGNLLFFASITCLADSTRGGGVIDNVFSDGVNQHITLATRFRQPVLLDSRRDDTITVTVRDDLSSLISFTAVALGYTIEIINSSTI